MSQNSRRIELEAADWAVRLQDGSLPAPEQAELDGWLQADARHRGALLRARAAWLDLDRLAALAAHRDEPLAGASPAHSHILPDRSLPFYRASQTLLRRARVSIVSRRVFFTAGATALILGGSSTWWLGRRSKVYVSNLGEVRRVTLSDGSNMLLNTASEATVRFDMTRRDIDLLTGEGLFQVVKDPMRPFVVRAGSISVRAVGTVFAVRKIGQQVDVTVSQGVVELLDGPEVGGGVIRRVAANERATVMETRQVEVLSMAHEEAERRFAWRDGMVDFSGEPLARAVEEINRYNRRQIVVDDGELAARPVVGLFRANDPEGFATTVSIALSVRNIDSADAIHLRASETP
jgi:transmembrane sensor